MSALRIDVFSEPVFQGNERLFRTENSSMDIPDVFAVTNFTVRSIRLAPGTGMTVFGGTQPFVGPEQLFTTSVGSLSGSRLGELMPRSIRLFPSTNRPHLGWCVIRVNPGQPTPQYLAAVPSRNPAMYTLGTSLSYGSDDTLWRFTGLESGLKVKKNFVPNPRQALSQYRLNEVVPLELQNNTVFVAASASTFKLRNKGTKGWINVGDNRNNPATYSNSQSTEFAFEIFDADNETMVGELRPGEIALYEQPTYWGRTWTLNKNLADFTTIRDLNDRVSSIILGPNTGATFYSEPGYNLAVNGSNAVDVINPLENLDTLGLNDKISSVKLWRVADPKQYGVTHTTRVSTDYPEATGNTTGTTVYRTQIEVNSSVSVPQSTGTSKRIEVWTTEPSEMTINGSKVNVSEQQHQSFEFQDKIALRILNDAGSLYTQPLKVRLSYMPLNEYTVIYPDTAMHAQFAAIATTLQASAAPVKGADQRAIFNSLNDQKLVAKTLELASQVTLGAGSQAPSAADDPGYDAILTGNTAPAPAEPIEFVFQPTSKSRGSTSEEGVVSVSKMGIIDVIRKAKNFFTKLLEDAKKVIIDPAAEFFKNLALSITDAAGNVRRFVLKTVDDVSKFCSALIDKVSTGINKFVEWAKTLIKNLLDLFNWGDVIDIKNVIVGHMNTAFDYTIRFVEWQKQPTLDGIKAFKDRLTQLTGSGTQSQGVTSASAPTDTSYSFDKLDWILDKINGLSGNANILGDLGLGGELAQLQNATADGFITTVTTTIELERIGASFSTGLARSIGRVWDTLSNFDALVENPKVLLDSVLDLFQQVINEALSAAEIVVGALFDLVVLVLQKVKDLFNKKLDIPGISWLYEKITGSRLSLIDLTALMIAIPLRAFQVKPEDIDYFPLFSTQPSTKSALVSSPPIGSRPPSLGDERAAMTVRSGILLTGDGTDATPASSSPSNTGSDAERRNKIQQGREIEVAKKALLLATGTVSGAISTVLDVIDTPESLATPTARNVNVVAVILEWINFAYRGLGYLADTPAMVTRAMNIPQAEEGSKEYSREVIETTLWAVNGAELMLDFAFLAGFGSSMKRAEYVGVGSAMTFGVLKLAFASTLTGMRTEKDDQWGNASAIIGSLPNLMAWGRVTPVISSTSGASIIAVHIINGASAIASTYIGIKELDLAKDKLDDPIDLESSPQPQPPLRINQPGDLVWHRYTTPEVANPNAWASDSRTSIGIGGWQSFSRVIGGFGGIIYAVGGVDLLRYRMGVTTRADKDAWVPGWSGVIDGGPWDKFKHIAGGHNEVLYAVDASGSLVYYRYAGGDSAMRNRWANGAGQTISPTVWGGYTRVFGGHNGVIYAVKPNGRLVWHRYLQLDRPNVQAWAGGFGREIDNGDWNQFKFLFGGVNGVIYAVTHQDSLRLYRHTGFDTGASDGLTLGSGTVISSQGWSRFKSVFGGGNGVIYGIVP